MEPLAGIPAELVGLGGGGAVLSAFIIWMTNKFLKRWLDTQDTMSSTLASISTFIVEHNVESRTKWDTIMTELLEQRKLSNDHAQAHTLILERTSHIGDGGSDD